MTHETQRQSQTRSSIDHLFPRCSIVEVELASWTGETSIPNWTGVLKQGSIPAGLTNQHVWGFGIHFLHMCSLKIIGGLFLTILPFICCQHLYYCTSFWGEEEEGVEEGEEEEDEDVTHQLPRLPDQEWLSCSAISLLVSKQDNGILVILQLCF